MYRLMNRVLSYLGFNHHIRLTPEQREDFRRLWSKTCMTVSLILEANRAIDKQLNLKKSPPPTPSVRKTVVNIKRGARRLRA